MKKTIIILISILIISGILFFILKSKNNYVFQLIGEENVYILLNGKYSDPGVNAFYKDENCNGQIVVNNNLNSSQEGTYTINYYFPKIDKSLTRTVYVSKFDEFIKFNKSLKEDKKSTDININIDKDKIDSFQFKNNTYKDNTTINIDSNGKYIVTITDKFSNNLEKEFTINEIIEDIVASCTAIVEEDKTTISVTSNNQISKYVYNNIEANTNTYIFDKAIPDNKVILYDINNQTKEITCDTTIKETKHLEIHFIKAQGYYDDAILIRSNKTTLFIDGGRGGSAVTDYLRTVGVKDIDYVIGSHTENDHIDTQGQIIREFNVKGAMYPNNTFSCGCRCEGIDVDNVNSALRSKGITPTIPTIPSKMDLRDMEIYFLLPTQLGCNKNNNSFVFIIKYGNNTFMFTGDQDSYLHNVGNLTSYANQIGLSTIKVDMFKYPHHGRQYLTEEFVQTVSPKYVLVPNNNAADSPSGNMQDLLRKYGASIYRQSDSSTGNIVLVSDGNNITVHNNTNPTDYVK